MTNKKITQVVARDVASKMLKRSNDKVDAINLKLSNYVSDLYLNTFSKDFLNTYEKYKNYFRKTSAIRVEGNGANQGIQLKNTIPCLNNSYTAIYQPTLKEAVIINVLTKELIDAKTEKHNLSVEIYNTLITLKSYSRIKTDFVEAYAFLPDTEIVSTALALPIESLRKKLKEI